MPCSILAGVTPVTPTGAPSGPGHLRQICLRRTNALVGRVRPTEHQVRDRGGRVARRGRRAGHVDERDGKLCAGTVLAAADRYGMIDDTGLGVVAESVRVALHDDHVAAGRGAEQPQRVGLGLAAPASPSGSGPAPGRRSGTGSHADPPERRRRRTPGPPGTAAAPRPRRAARVANPEECGRRLTLKAQLPPPRGRAAARHPARLPPAAPGSTATARSWSRSRPPATPRPCCSHRSGRRRSRARPRRSPTR